MLLGYAPPKRGLYRILYRLFHCLPRWRPAWMDWCLPGSLYAAPDDDRSRQFSAGFLDRIWPVCGWGEGHRWGTALERHKRWCPARIPTLYNLMRWRLDQAFYRLMDRNYVRVSGPLVVWGSGKPGCELWIPDYVQDSNGNPLPPGKWEIVGPCRPDEDAVYARPCH